MEQNIDLERERDKNLECWMKEYGTDLLRMNFLYLKDLQLAEDMTQETFLKAYKQYKQFRGESSIKTWLIRISINLCKDQLKKVWFRKVDLFDNIQFLEKIQQNSLFQTELSNYLEVQQKNENLFQQIIHLSRKNREVIVMYYYQQCSTKEIGEILNISQNTVSTRLKRAKEQLRKKLKGGWKNEEGVG